MPARTVPVRAFAAVGAVAVLVAGLSACASASDDNAPEHRTFALQGRTLTVDSDDSALEIVASDDHASGKVQVTRWFSGSVALGSDPEVTWKMDGDRLVLRMHCSGVVADCAAKHRIEVPRGVAVKVRDGDGSVRASGFEDALNIRTGDGSVTISLPRATYKVSTDTGDGAVDVSVPTDDTSAHVVDARSGDGGITVRTAN